MTSVWRHAQILRREALPRGRGSVELVRAPDGKVAVRRTATRNRISTVVSEREVHRAGVVVLEPIDEPSGNTIVDRLRDATFEGDCFIFHEGDEPQSIQKSPQELLVTSSAVKFARNRAQMASYRAGPPYRTVISTHVSPEGACNLKCPYCSVTYRDTRARLSLDTIQDYVLKLRTRGLRGLILTGGGEPTIYREINELLLWARHEVGLDIGLITNGTVAGRVTPEAWATLAWVRVSINFFDGWQDRISIPAKYLSPDCVVGCSVVLTPEHEMSIRSSLEWLTRLRDVVTVADTMAAQYVRLLPNCSLPTPTLLAQHSWIEKLVAKLDDDRFFQQHKMHRRPASEVCHQAYFRPYLSEEPFRGATSPGSVYPCDSVVLNDGIQRFETKYQLCAPADILDFMDGRITPQFTPTRDCGQCVFADTVDMLETWRSTGVLDVEVPDHPVLHEQFP